MYVCRLELNHGEAELSARVCCMWQGVGGWRARAPGGKRQSGAGGGSAAPRSAVYIRLRWLLNGRHRSPASSSQTNSSHSIAHLIADSDTDTMDSYTQVLCAPVG